MLRLPIRYKLQHPMARLGELSVAIAEKAFVAKNTEEKTRT